MNATITHPTRSIRRHRRRIDRTSWASIRPIERSDASELFSFYRRLSPRSMRARFLSGSAPSTDDIRRLACAPGYVAVRNDPGADDGMIIGHASLHPDGTGGGEVAVAVADEVQGRGLGTRLMAATVAHGRRIGLGRITAVLLATNGRMRRMLVQSGARIVVDDIDGGTEEITLDLARAA
jgi:RimJ/RimL family protein N-acetyltransferase